MFLFVRWLCFFCSMLSFSAFAATDDEASIQGVSTGTVPTTGNFALPGPQEPGPLLSFGQTLIGRNKVQLSVDTYSPYSLGGAFDNLNAGLIYGFTDTTSLFFNYPIRNNPETRSHRATSLKDVSIQLEHSIYSSGTRYFQEQGTIVGAVSLPSQNAESKSTGLSFGQPSYFIGATWNRTYVDWMYFASPGFIYTTEGDGIQLGSQYLYQAGLGRALLSVPNQSILFGLLEMNGQYTEKNSFRGRSNPNSGGDIITLTPSLWLSSPWFIVQVGVGFPVLQQLNGNQTNMNYYIASNISWTIN